MEYYVHFYKKKNFGDDLFVYLLAKSFPNSIFHISNYDMNYLSAFKKLSNIHIHRDTYVKNKIAGLSRRFLRENIVLRFRAKKCNGIIYIGGSLFIQPDSKEVDYYYAINKSLKIKGKPFYLIGANFGPYKDEEFLTFFRQEFRSYARISFRDRYSYNLFRELPQTQFFPDIAFISRNFFLNQKKVKKQITVSLMGKNNIEQYDLYYTTIRTWLQKYLEQGYEICLLAMCSLQEDNITCQQMKNELNSNKVNYLVYDGNIEEIIFCIRDSEYVIGTRFHSIVTALSLETPILPICYSNKTVNMLNDIGYVGLCADANKLDEITFSDIENNKQGYNGVNPRKLAERAIAHFDFLIK